MIQRALPLLALVLSLAGAARAQEGPDFKKMIERGQYEALGRKLSRYLDLEHADPKLRRYLEMNLEFLARGARPLNPGSELVLFRGAKNDQVFSMPSTSGGHSLMLPNSIRYQRRSWDQRLPRIDAYFREATTERGGNGEALRELDRIVDHHKGGGLGKNSNSVKSVLISTSTRPIQHFGPPYYILKVAPERAIFNTKGLSSEYEVLLPFWVLPTEVVARCETWEELRNHPLYQESKLKDVEMRTWGYGAGGSRNNWELIEENIRLGRPPLEGLAGLNSFFPGDGREVGPDATRGEVERFVEKVGRHGGVVEWVGPADLRLPAGAQARTYIGADGRPKVLLRRGEAVKKVAILDELTHVIQLEQMVKARGAPAVEELLLRSQLGDPAARDVVNRWEIRAKRLVRAMTPAGDPLRGHIDRSIAELEKELDPYVASRRADGTIDWRRVRREVGTGLAHFTLSLFLKELALVARTGDALRIEEFFDGLLKTDFYVHYGLFSVGAATADAAYGAFLERHVARFVRPRFVQSVLRSNVSLAVGMALPDLVAGRFDGRTFAINLAGLGLSSTAVKAGSAALRWVFQLDRLPGGARLATRLSTMTRLTRVGGFAYQVLETAVVLYFGDELAREIDERLERRRAEDAVRSAAARLATALRSGGDDARAALDDLAAANRAYRDVLARPLAEVEGLLWERLGRAGVESARADAALTRYRELAARDPARYGALAAAAERFALRREAEGRADVERVFESFERSFGRVARDVYGEPGHDDPWADPSLRWALRGQAGESGDPYGARTDFLARFGRDRLRDRALDEAADLPGTRLAAYAHEAAFYEALAAAHAADDPLLADQLRHRAAVTRDLMARDRDLVLGEGRATAGRDEPARPLDDNVRGFIDALERAEGTGR